MLVVQELCLELKPFRITFKNDILYIDFHKYFIFIYDYNTFYNSSFAWEIKKSRIKSLSNNLFLYNTFRNKIIGRFNFE